MNRIEDLIGIVERLRDPERGCPWDRVQTFRTIAPCTIEEACEVADAVEREDLRALVDELGDLLFQVVFHAQIACESGAFRFDDVVDAITGKMIRRHPHVFGDADGSIGVAEQSRTWEEMKAAERSADGSGDTESLLDGVPVTLPALTRAVKLQRRAARYGFDWPDSGEVLDKITEEVGELREAMRTGGRAEIEGELGDLLFTVANLARHLGADPESAARAANRKFERRFRDLERRTGGASAGTLDPESLDRIWSRIKAEEERTPPAAPPGAVAGGTESPVPRDQGASRRIRPGIMAEGGEGESSGPDR